MFHKNPKVVVGFTVFGNHTAKYLPYFLDSLKNQDYVDFKVIVVDNLKMKSNQPYQPIKDEASTKYLKENYPEIEVIESIKNTGFARSHNKIIKRAIEIGARYYLVLNPDTFLEKDALSKMVKVLEGDGELASVSPKILKWDFENNKKTEIIDTCGIGMKDGLRFFDVLQGELSKEDQNPEILGPSGACGLYRLSSIDRVAERGSDFFDENMFMYKEDCDLAYRLFLVGFKTSFVKDAFVYHDRTIAGKKGLLGVFVNRFKKNKQANKWSLLNQLIIFEKYGKKQEGKSKYIIVLWKITAVLGALFFQQYMLKEFLTFMKIRNKLQKY